MIAVIILVSVSLILRNCKVHTDTLYGLRVASDGSGGGVVLYENAVNGNILAQRIDSDGRILWGQRGTLVGNRHSDYYCYPYLNIAGDGNGGAIVSWPDFSSDPITPVRQLARLDPDGQILWQQDCVSFDRFIGDGLGGVIIAFDYSSDVSDTQAGEDMLTLIRVDSEGNFPWGLQGITIKRERYQDNSMQITSDGNGGVIFVWEEWIYENIFHIMVQKIDTDGGFPWGTEGRVIITTYQDATIEDTRITGDGNGGGFVAWRQLPVGIVEAGSPEAMLNDICVQKIDVNGDFLYSSEGIPLGIAKSGGEPRPVGTLLASDDSGGVIVYWRDLREGVSNFLNIYAQRIDSAGNILWEPGGVNVTFAGMYPECQMTSVGWGNTVSSYVSKGYGTKGLHVQKVDANGNPEWQENGVEITADYFTSKSFTPDGTGGVIIGWCTGKGWFHSEKAYIQRISPDGQMLWGPKGIRLNK